MIGLVDREKRDLVLGDRDKRLPRGIFDRNNLWRPRVLWRIEYFLLGMARETLLISRSVEIKERRLLLAWTESTQPHTLSSQPQSTGAPIRENADLSRPPNATMRCETYLI